MDETTERCPPPDGCEGDWLEEIDRYLDGLGDHGFEIDLCAVGEGDDG
jgi:hypothetical protein